VKLERRDGEAIISVRDEGIGIAPDMLPRVFELFTQATSALDRSQGGMGIGLTLVKGLAEMHTGRVEAHSDGLGRGSVFSVRLPALEVQSQPVVIASRSEPQPTRTLHVVLIEDSEDIRETLRTAFEDAGHRAEAAADGPSGLAMLLAGQPEVAVVDIGLPGIDGYEVARRARAELGSSIRLIALSGYGQPEDKRRALASGFDVHLTKPVDLDSLCRLIAEP
jgi:two-component system, sensor histidine kinase